jgi:hypothetical protein
VNVEAPKRGIDLACSHRVLNELYPQIPSGKSFVPYISTVWLNDALPERR